MIGGARRTVVLTHVIRDQPNYLQSAAYLSFVLMLWLALPLKKPQHCMDQQAYQAAHQPAHDIVTKVTGKPTFFLAQLALIGKRGGSQELYLADSGAQNIRPLTQDRTHCLKPRWSPDNRLISYASYLMRWPDVYTIDVKNGTRTRAAFDEATGEWVLNGEKAFITNSGTDITSLVTVTARTEKSVSMPMYTRFRMEAWAIRSRRAADRWGNAAARFSSAERRCRRSRR